MKYIVVGVDYVSKWVQAISLSNNYGKSVTEKSIFSRFSTPRENIREGSFHFCNKLVEALLNKYSVCYNVVTLCHSEFSGQVEVSNR